VRVTVRPVSAGAVERDEHHDQSSRFCSAGHAGGGPRYRGDGGIDPGDRLGRRSAGGDNVVSGINDLNPGNFDFGAILFDDNVLNTGASGADYLYDIVTTLGIESNSFAAASTDWWADLLALF
jgi:hypothetical protein